MNSMKEFWDGLVDQIKIRSLINFVESGRNVIAQGHFDHSSINKQLLEHINTKLVLHLRDPRQVIISWIHHLDRITGGEYSSEHNLSMYPRVPTDYFDGTLERKVAWHIENTLANLNHWISNWVKYADQNPGLILITEFRELNSIETLIGRICKFYDIGIPKVIKSPPLDSDHEQTHFRLGRTDEFVEIMNEDQLKFCTKIAPKPVYKRFDWPLHNRSRNVFRMGRLKP